MSRVDAMTGKPLEFAVVSGAEAKKDPLMARADEGTDYIRVTLARPVPENGQGRVVIVKTYKDAKSYYLMGRRLCSIVRWGSGGIRWCCRRGMRWWG